MFLTSEQLADLTDAKQVGLQIAWLDAHGWVYELSRLGNPKVLLAYANKRMGMAEKVSKAANEPDFSRWRDGSNT